MNFGIQIKGITIADAWEGLVRTCLEDGVSLSTGRDIRAGTLSLLGGQIIIEEPLAEPMVSDKFVNDRAFCETYALEYLLLDTIQPGEDYTYGNQIHKNEQLDKCIKRMKENPYLRTFCLEVGEPSLFGANDPPCLRLVDFRVVDNALHTFFYFRSWDIFKAANANLVGIARLAEYVAKEVGGLEVGQLIGFFKDAHIYEKDLEYVREVFRPKSVYGNKKD
ncbi:MAG: thymidylate synthase [Candidatus Hydrothermarchaeales archaeon]